ncbi:MAG TPA: hypothetical protein PLZ11_16135, partial [Thauera sp.]|nr:hypothetical protein [Thauera sp.]
MLRNMSDHPKTSANRVNTTIAARIVFSGHGMTCILKECRGKTVSGCCRRGEGPTPKPIAARWYYEPASAIDPNGIVPTSVQFQPLAGGRRKSNSDRLTHAQAPQARTSAAVAQARRDAVDRDMDAV